MTIYASVDIRGKCSEVRDQGTRQSCLACSTSDAHAIHHGSPPLSAEFLFYHAIQIAAVGNLADGLTFLEVAQALEKNGQPAETDWPYNLTQPSPWSPPSVTKIWNGRVEHDPSAPAAEIAALIAKGTPVVLAISLSAAFIAPDIPDFVIPADGDGFGGHAVLVVGLGTSAGGATHLLIRNSWGEGWGNRGYAWLPVDYLSNKLIGYAAIVGP